MPMTRMLKFFISDELFEELGYVASQKHTSMSKIARIGIRRELDRIAVEKSQSIARVREMQQASR
jgi:hypothetical protein